MKTVLLRLACLLVIPLVLLSTAIPVAALTVSTQEEMSVNYSSATLEDDFEDDCLLITIKNDYSEVNKIWTANQLGLSNVADIVDLTAVPEGLNDVFSEQDDFEQMLKINLSVPGKQRVLDMMREATQSSYISYVSPSFIYEVVETSVDTQEVLSYANASARSATTGETLPTNVWNAEKWELYDIGAVDAWEEYGTGSSEVTVAVMDSGIVDHEDLNANVIERKDFTKGGYDTGHGTFVAGLIGAVGDNDIGITGVCWDVNLMSLRVSVGGNISIANVAEAFLYVCVRDVDIVNLSIYVYRTESGIEEDVKPDLTLLKRAMNMFDGLIVCAAGNSNSLLSETSEFVSFPAMFELDNMIVVGGTCKGMCADGTISERKAVYSNYGTDYVDIMAPGGAGEFDGGYIAGTDENGNLIFEPPGEGLVPSTLQIKSTLANDSKYGYDGGGTSFAAPLVSGSAALLLSHNPNLTALELKYILMNSVDTQQTNSTLEDFSDLCVSGGRLNVYRALQMVMEGDQTRTVVAAAKLPTATTIPAGTYTFAYDLGKYELVSASLSSTFSEGVSINTLTPGQIKVTFEQNSTEAVSGRMLYCEFITRLNTSVGMNELQCTDQVIPFSTCSALLGDVNNNNEITTEDARICLSLVEATVTDYQLLAADYDGDGVITQSDATAILNMAI